MNMLSWTGTYITVMLLIFSFLVPSFTPLLAQDTDDAANIANVGTNIKQAGESTTQTSNSVLNKIKEFGLDKAAEVAAKRLLLKLSDSLIRWAGTGFQDGEPFYVADRRSYLQRIGDDTVVRLVDGLLDEIESPFARDLAQFAVLNYTNSLDQQLNFDSGLDEIVDEFENDFNSGGWEAWLDITTDPSNNYIGGQIILSEESKRRVEEQKQRTIEEIASNDGFLNARECVGATDPSFDSDAAIEGSGGLSVYAGIYDGSTIGDIFTSVEITAATGTSFTGSVTFTNEDPIDPVSLDTGIQIYLNGTPIAVIDGFTGSIAPGNEAVIPFTFEAESVGTYSIEVISLSSTAIYLAETEIGFFASTGFGSDIDLVIYEYNLSDGADCEARGGRWRTTTPGQLILSRLDAALGQPEKQLAELDDFASIVSNALFVMLDELTARGVNALVGTSGTLPPSAGEPTLSDLVSGATGSGGSSGSYLSSPFFTIDLITEDPVTGETRLEKDIRLTAIEASYYRNIDISSFLDLSSSPYVDGPFVDNPYIGEASEGDITALVDSLRDKIEDFEAATAEEELEELEEEPDDDTDAVDDVGTALDFEGIDPSSLGGPLSSGTFAGGIPVIDLPSSEAIVDEILSSPGAIVPSSSFEPNEGPGIINIHDGLPALGWRLDVCIPGPETGFEERTRDVIQRKTFKLQRKADKDNDNAEDHLGELQFIYPDQLLSIQAAMVTPGTTISGAPIMLEAVNEQIDLATDRRQDARRYQDLITTVALLVEIQNRIDDIVVENDFGILEITDLDEAGKIAQSYVALQPNISTEGTLGDTIALLSQMEVFADRLVTLTDACYQQRATELDPFIDVADRVGVLYCSAPTSNAAIEAAGILKYVDRDSSGNSTDTTYHWADIFAGNIAFSDKKPKLTRFLKGNIRCSDMYQSTLIDYIGPFSFL